MIGLLAKFVRASNSFKIGYRYFGKVWRKSNVCIIRFDWLIALYLFTLLHRNASFLIVKNSCVKEEVSDVNKSMCKNIFLVRSRLCTSPFFLCTSPTDTFPFTYHPFNGPGMCAVDNFQRLRFGNSRSPDNFAGKPKIVSSQESLKQKSMFAFTFTLRIIYDVNGTSLYLERCSPATDNDAIIAVLLQHEEDNFSKLTVKNRLKIDRNKSVPKKW